ncbi:tetratricopeptide repeat protein 19, mitochondrial isoform X1 [Tachyglossus aculeatus]|uniref:tetratricopeptide repeat protein 19, mitochondrial isoform X1 n=1 Tax=Tachyglossus aculeatus TaxID=9261 RepID=UPI0018F61879|nr:tetratricopeptide repeat protein 19, mitochondrial isoform X1 [Tachyglossus aculeatus]XP_038615830.1 tetratricopeptide repeat protein 19, mitochondrial isoform X1 [Tachyglossus aculeatus]
MMGTLRRGLGLLVARRRRWRSWSGLPPPGPGPAPPRPRGYSLLPLAAFTWFSKPATQEKEEEEEKEGADEKPSEHSDAEANIILMLKRAKLYIMKEEPEEAERILHEALRLAHQSGNTQAIIYTYDLMANLAFLRGQLGNAEKLFKAAMSYLLAGGMKQEDNAIIEISLKLASIYAAQNQHEFALPGYEFCISTLEKKIERERELTEDDIPAEEKANTHLLLGMCLDSYARYLLTRKQLPLAQKMYEKALQISRDVQGERHPQTVVLMNDLATTLDAQGHYDDAYNYVKRASDLAKQTEHPEMHMVLSNLAGILMHKEKFAQAKRTYQEALKQAELKGDLTSIQHIKEELAELSRRSKGS